MAELGNSTGAGSAHTHKATSWITVALICVAAIVLGFAFVLGHVPLAAVGGVIALAGVVLGVRGKIMDDAH